MPHRTHRALPLPQAALLAAAVSMLAAGAAHSQARGPSQQQIRQTGQPITTPAMRREQRWLEARILADQARQREEAERIALLDPEYRFRKFADLQDFLEIMPGRYRIESRIQYRTTVAAPALQYSTGESGSATVYVPSGAVPITRSWSVAGSAECMRVELEAELRCRFEPGVLPVASGGRLLSYLDMTDNMRPAALLLALEREQPQVHWTLVADGMGAQGFTGGMDDGIISSKPNGMCLMGLCFLTLEASASADAEQISLVLSATGMTVRLIMQRVSPPLRDNVLRPDSALLSPGVRR